MEALVKFAELVRQHDLAYQYSDDYSVRLAGQRKESTVQKHTQQHTAPAPSTAALIQHATATLAALQTFEAMLRAYARREGARGQQGGPAHGERTTENCPR